MAVVRSFAMNEKNSEYLDKILALVLWMKDNDGEDDVAIFPGTLVQENTSLVLKCHDENHPEIREEWLSGITKVPDDLKETLFGCSFQLSLTVRDREVESDPLVAFGLR